MVRCGVDKNKPLFKGAVEAEMPELAERAKRSGIYKISLHLLAFCWINIISVSPSIVFY